jgi:uncharacterized protein involved in exopolysaccharide biosynthesis
MSAGQRTLREEIDRVVMLIKRSFAFWRRSLLIFMVTMLVTVPFVFTRPRSYRSETVILYQETIRSSDLTGGEAGQSDSRRVGARLREMLLSRASLEPIVKDLNLYGANSDKRGGLVDAVDDMRKHISFRAREGDTFEISFTGDTPQQTQEVTRRLGDCIVQEAVTRRSEQAKALKDFLDAESERNKTDLKAKENELAKFLALHPEFAPPPGTPLGTAPLPRPAGQVAKVAEDPAIVALEARAARLERQLKPPGTPVVPVPTVAPPPTQEQPQDSPELLAARRDLAEKMSKYTDKHPDVIAAKNRVKAAEAAQATARAAIPTPTAQPTPTPIPDETPQATLTPEERESLKRQLNQIVNEIAIRRAVLKSAGGAPAPAASESPVSLEVEYRRLLHEVTETRERQRQLDEKQFKAAITASSVMSDRNIQVSVLDPAFLPSHPISSPRSIMLIVGFVIGIALGILMAIVSARLDDRIHDRIDLEVLDILPVVGVIPRLTAGDRKEP